MKQTEIKRTQNNDFFLKCQYAAKFYFNRAEHLNYYVWIFCLLSAMTVFIPGSNNWLIIGVPLALDIIGSVFEYHFEKSVATASKLRNYFDANVLDINKSQYSENDIRKIKDIIERTVTKHSEDCRMQISHTGNDNPPGVLNWYEFSHKFSDDEVQYECQRQNCWWNKELSKRRILSFIILFIITICIIVIGCRYLNFTDNIIRIFLCSSVVLKIAERVFQHSACHRIFLKIQGASELLEKSKTIENIEALQLMIEKRREIPVLEVNAIHKRFAKKLSDHYKKIS